MMREPLVRTLRGMRLITRPAFCLCLICATLIVCVATAARAQDATIGFSVATTSAEQGDVEMPASEGDPWLEAEEEQAAWVSVRAGAITLYRSSNRDEVLFWSPLTGEPLLSTSDVDHGWAVGPELDVLLQLTSDWSFEFDWFMLDNWSGLRSVDMDPTLVEPIDAPVLTALLESSSNLHNFEFNLRRNVTERLTLLAGFRYVELDESFTLTLETPLFPDPLEAARLGTRNHLYGFQLGANAALWQSGPWQLDGWIKAGIYGNAARSSADVYTFAAPPEIPHYAAEKSSAAFLGDLGLRASRSFGEHVQIYGGYRVMLLDGVALAVDQIENAGLFFGGGPTQLSTGGSPFYHGAELGLVFSF